MRACVGWAGLGWGWYQLEKTAWGDERRVGGKEGWIFGNRNCNRNRYCVVVLLFCCFGTLMSTEETVGYKERVG